MGAGVAMISVLLRFESGMGRAATRGFVFTVCMWLAVPVVYVGLSWPSFHSPQVSSSEHVQVLTGSYLAHVWLQDCSSPQVDRFAASLAVPTIRQG